MQVSAAVTNSLSTQKWEYERTKENENEDKSEKYDKAKSIFLCSAKQHDPTVGQHSACPAGQ